MTRWPPLLAILLGAAGLLPVAAAAAAILLDTIYYDPAFHQAVMIYGALIISFIGGAHWGLAARSPDTSEAAWAFGGSVIPSLVAWVAALLPGGFAAIALALCFFAILTLDFYAHYHGLAPRWWLSLRIPLSGLMGFLFAVIGIAWVL